MDATHKDFEYIRSVAKNVAGISFEASKDYFLATRLGPLATKTGYSSITELVQNLRTAGPGSGLEREVIDALTINETSFFRDAPAFERLAETVLPEVIAANAATRRLKIWSAACSTGQEVYSIAILLREKFPSLARWHVELYATDISDRVLEKAKTGVYSDFEVRRGINETLQKKYFNPVGEYESKISEELSRSVTFSRHNLFGSWDKIGQYDIIMLRNVLIYFKIPEKQHILLQASKHLRRCGHLFLGTSETTHNIDSNWISEGVGASSFRLEAEVNQGVLL